MQGVVSIAPSQVKERHGLFGPTTFRDRIRGADPDTLLAPDLEAGNILAKLLTFLANADSAGLVLGARVPLVLTSPADSVRSKIASCAVAKLVAHARGAKPQGAWT